MNFDMESILARVPDYQEFYTVDELNQHSFQLAKEYPDVVEVTELGLTSRDYTVAMVQIGPVKLGSTGLRALSEIGAHAFARTYHDLLRQKEAQEDGTEV